jgi:hypothetical protein
MARTETFFYFSATRSSNSFTLQILPGRPSRRRCDSPLPRPLAEAVATQGTSRAIKFSPLRYCRLSGGFFMRRLVG